MNKYSKFSNIIAVVTIFKPPFLVDISLLAFCTVNFTKLAEAAY